jgi:hypothetical protein
MKCSGRSWGCCVEQILKRKHDFEITIFGDEPLVNYNRILLSLVLAGEKSARQARFRPHLPALVQRPDGSAKAGDRVKGYNEGLWDEGF